MLYVYITLIIIKHIHILIYVYTSLLNYNQ